MSIGTSELAKKLGISRQRVNELGRMGKIPREANGKWNLARVRSALEKNLDIHQASPSLGAKRKSPRIRETPSGSTRRPPQDEPDIGSQVSLARVQLKHEIAKTAKTQLEVAKLQGVFIDKYQAQCEWGAMITTARNRALLIPSKLAPKVAVVSDVLECQHILDREIRSFLSELSEYQSNA